MLHGFRILRSASLGVLLLLQWPACFGAGSPGGLVAGGLLLAKATAAPALSRLAGLPSGAGCLDGPGAAARFDRPCGVAVDQAGDVYVADSRNGVIRRISPAGLVSTVLVPAGLLGAPASVAVDPAGVHLWVADPLAPGAPGVFRIDIGSPGHWERLPAPEGGYGTPQSVAVDGAGIVYVADSARRAVYAITKDLTVLAAPLEGYDTPSGLAVDPDGSVYVADSGLARDRPGIYKIGKNHSITHLLTGTASMRPLALAVDPQGRVLFMDSSHAVFALAAAGGYALVAGGPSAGSTDGVGFSARFSFDPLGGAIAVAPGGRIYLTDTGNNTVRTISYGRIPEYQMWNVATLAGVAGGLPGHSAIRDQVSFDRPMGVAVTRFGCCVADYNNAAIRILLWPTSKQAGSAWNLDVPPGTFGGVRGVAGDADDNLYVTDKTRHAVFQLTPPASLAVLERWTVSTLAGDWVAPWGVAVGGDGVVYVADEGRQAVFRIVRGVATQLPQPVGGWIVPSGVAVDRAGHLFVADAGTQCIYERAIGSGDWITLAGTGAVGHQDGAGHQASFNHPQGLAVDADGNLYVADTGGNTVRKLTLAWVAGALTAGVTTPVGVAGTDGTRTGVLPAGLHAPSALAVTATGGLIIAVPDALVQVQ